MPSCVHLVSVFVITFTWMSIFIIVLRGIGCEYSDQLRCQQGCVDTEDSYYCVCREGYNLVPVQRNCTSMWGNKYINKHGYVNKRTNTQINKLLHNSSPERIQLWKEVHQKICELILTKWLKNNFTYIKNANMILISFIMINY